MPGTFVFKPLEANLTHNTDLIGKMNPYCAFVLGNERVKGQVCKKGGKHPHWNDAVSIPATNQSTIVLELMDQDRITHDDNIGTCMIDLQEVQSRGQVSRWYPLTYKNKPAGEILMEAVFQGDASSFGQGQLYQGEQLGMASAGYQGEQLGMASTAYQGEQIGGLSQGGFVQQQETITTQAPIVQEQVSVEQSANLSHASEGSHVFVEQRQSVEPHTFTKSVDVVETRPVMKEIEVLEPVKVIKDVQYTEAVPVRHQIEVVEPQVVKKDVEVIEPRLVTKQIQVVENVPVMKQVEVIEPRTFVKEVETFEPQTFTKQVEVTEQVPVKKAVTVTEPVTVTKAVDFVEPVITTKTVTKEIQQPVVVDQKITTTVGPATVVGIETEVRERFGEIRITEEQRILEQRRLEEQRILEQRRLEEQRLQGNQVGGYSTTTTTTYQSDQPTYQTSQQIANGINQTYTNEFTASQNKF